MTSANSSVSPLLQQCGILVQQKGKVDEKVLSSFLTGVDREIKTLCSESGQGGCVVSLDTKASDTSDWNNRLPAALARANVVQQIFDQLNKARIFVFQKKDGFLDKLKYVQNVLRKEDPKANAIGVFFRACFLSCGIGSKSIVCDSVGNLPLAQRHLLVDEAIGVVRQKFQDFVVQRESSGTADQNDILKKDIQQMSLSDLSSHVRAVFESLQKRPEPDSGATSAAEPAPDAVSAPSVTPESMDRSEYDSALKKCVVANHEDALGRQTRMAQILGSAISHTVEPLYYIEKRLFQKGAQFIMSAVVTPSPPTLEEREQLKRYQEGKRVDDIATKFLTKYDSAVMTSVPFTALQEAASLPYLVTTSSEGKSIVEGGPYYQLAHDVRNPNQFTLYTVRVSSSFVSDSQVRLALNYETTPSPVPVRCVLEEGNFVWKNSDGTAVTDETLRQIQDAVNPQSNKSLHKVRTQLQQTYETKTQAINRDLLAKYGHKNGTLEELQGMISEMNTWVKAEYVSGASLTTSGAIPPSCKVVYKGDGDQLYSANITWEGERFVLGSHEKITTDQQRQDISRIDDNKTVKAFFERAQKIESCIENWMGDTGRDKTWSSKKSVAAMTTLAPMLGSIPACQGKKIVGVGMSKSGGPELSVLDLSAQRQSVVNFTFKVGGTELGDTGTQIKTTEEIQQQMSLPSSQAYANYGQFKVVLAEPSRQLVGMNKLFDQLRTGADQFLADISSLEGCPDIGRYDGAIDRIKDQMKPVGLFRRSKFSIPAKVHDAMFVRANFGDEEHPLWLPCALKLDGNRQPVELIPILYVEGDIRLPTSPATQTKFDGRLQDVSLEQQRALIGTKVQCLKEALGMLG